MKLMGQVASKKDPAALSRLIESSSWKTFLAIAKESGSSPPSPCHALTDRLISPAPTASANGQQPTKFDDGFEIPPDVDVPPPENFDRFDDDIDMTGDNDGPPGGGGEGDGVVACPHCTFENEVGKVDCDVCGLPLAG